MPLNKLENFIKNYEGRILYVNSNDLDATDSITNQGNSLTKPFKTIQRALLESARFSFVAGNNNDRNDRTTILVYPGEHVIDNRPGYGIKKIGTALAQSVAPDGSVTIPASDELTLTLESNFDLTQENNILYKFNSVNGGVILPRGTSIVGLDLRKTKIRPKYVPNPTDSDVPSSSIFRITGNCYFWNFSFFDASESELVYTNNRIFTSGTGNQSTPTFSHHKLTCFEYADGVNVPTGYDITDLDMYYAKIGNAFNEGSGRQIPAAQKFPLAPQAFSKERPEWEIVGAFGSDPIIISSLFSGDSATPSPIVTVNTLTDHELTAGTPIKIRGANVKDYNITTTVQTVIGPKSFTYLLPFVRSDLNANPSGSASVTIETDTVKGSSPYIFNISLRSVYGMNGMHADGSKAAGFRSMVVAQFTAVSLQKDDRAFVKYNPITRTYSGIPVTKTLGTLLSSGSSSTDNDTIYHLDADAIYRTGWETSHIKCSNDSVIQVVSVFAIGFNRHFVAESGGDQSITNSNSNFGQISLSASGFKKEAFSKDDYGYITSIITPRSVISPESKIDWIPIDVGLTTSVGISSHLYLFGFNSQDNVPPNLIQGYRVGARKEDKLYLELPNRDIKSTKILMTDTTLVSGGSSTVSGTNSAVKEYVVGSLTSAPNYDTIQFTTTHKLQNGEKIIIISDTGDLPENVTEHKTYYTIVVDNTRIKLASSFTNAQNNVSLKMYGGSQLRIQSRVSDRDAGQLGSPIQFDPNHNNWFVYVERDNDIYNSVASLGVVGFEEPRTGVTYFNRISDSRSLDEKIYKVRIVVPKESPNGKDPQDGFVIQESSTTGAITDSDFSLSSIDTSNYNFQRNYRFISTCTESSGTVTAITELPHNLTQGDRVLIKNVKSSTNLTGVGVTGFNGDFIVSSVPDANTFSYSTTDYNSITHNVGIFSGPTSRSTTLPRFERNDLQSNFFIYRSETISPYIFNVQDGIYHAYVLKSDNAVPDHFTDYKYNQNIVDLYPQQDRDNYEDNPPSAVTFAKRSPIGDVVTNDLKKSITRETVDSLVKKLGITPIIQSVSPLIAGVTTVTTTREHGFNGVVGFATLTSGTGYNSGTYYNVKLLNSDDSWNGARATVVISGVANSITSLNVTSPGSGYNDGVSLKVDGFSGSTIGITTTTISYLNDNSLQITGLGTATDGLYRVIRVPSKNQIAIARTTGDPAINPNQYVFNVASSTQITSVVYNSTVGISTITCFSAHGLVAGNRFRVLDTNNNNLGDHIVNDTVGVTTFTVSGSVNTNSTRILKHGFSSNNLISDAGSENLAARGISFYDNESAILITDIATDTTSGIATFPIRVVNSGISTVTRFPIGSFIQVDNEIMRVSKSTLTGSGNNEITVLRGYLGTQKETHLANSLIKKIKPLAIELRRPSILRASGHTFEYLGYGPGNYSTGLPQIQVKTLTEREDFLSQSQERSCGSVVYTGMNSDGDFFIGNTKYSSASGQQTTFDIPIPTVTGQDPSRLSVVFDEVIVKERILVEGGKSKQILSQFDGPTTFNNNAILNGETKINGEVILSNILRQNNNTDSTAVNNGSIVTKGGVGILRNLNVGGNVSISGTSTFNGQVQFNTGLVPDSIEDAFIGSPTKPWASGWFGGIGISTEGTPGGTEIEDRRITGWTGDLVLNSIGAGTSVRIENTSFYAENNAIIVGILTVGRTSITIDGSSNSIGVGKTASITLSPAGSLVLSSTNGAPHEFDNVKITNTLETVGIATFRSSVIVDSQLTAKSNLNVTGVTTSSTGFFPLTDSGAPLGSLALSFSEAFVDNLKLDDNTLSSTNTNGNITLSANGTGVVETVNDVNFGTSGDNSTLTVVGQLNADNLRLDTNSITSTDSNGNIILDANGTGIIDINSPIDVEGHANFQSTSNFVGEVTVETGIIPDTAGDAAYLGSNAKPFSSAFIGNIRIAEGTASGNDNTITTSSGDLNIDAFSNNINIKGNLNVDNIATFNDNVIIQGSTKTFEIKDGSSVTKLSVATNTGDTVIQGTLTLVGGLTLGGKLAVNDVTDSTSSTDANASFRTAGGAAIAKKLYVGDTLTVSANGFAVTGNSSISSGTLTVASGLTVTSGGLTVTAGGLTVTAGGISAAGQTVSASTFTGNANSASTAANLSFGGSNEIVFKDGSNNAATSGNLTFDGSNLRVSGELRAGGDVVAYHSSDRRLKTNISIIEDAINKVSSISGVTFNWNELATTKDPSLREAGIIAQEVKEVLPEVVTERDNGYLAVNYEKIVPLLIEAIKELNVKVQDLEQKLADK